MPSEPLKRYRVQQTVIEEVTVMARSEEEAEAHSVEIENWSFIEVSEREAWQAEQ